MKRLSVLLLLAVCFIFAGCPNSSAIKNIDLSDLQGMTEDDLDKLFESQLPGPSLPPSEISDEIICTAYADRGLLRICYVNNSGAKVKLQVFYGDIKGERMTYDLKGDGSPEDFPLQYGNGKYIARIMQNTRDNEYFSVESKSFDVEIADNTNVFLNSVQNVNWNYSMEPIHDVRYIVISSLKQSVNAALYYSCISDIYDYIIRSIKYDNGKAKNLPYDYLPDIEQTYHDNKGICYDYSSLFASMLRSIGIPTKLVTGYADYNPDVYHAWNEIYINGKWITIDTTRDATLFGNGGSYSMEKSSDDYTIIHIY